MDVAVTDMPPPVINTMANGNRTSVTVWALWPTTERANTKATGRITAVMVKVFSLTLPVMSTQDGGASVTKKAQVLITVTSLV